MKKKIIFTIILIVILTTTCVSNISMAKIRIRRTSSYVLDDDEYYVYKVFPETTVKTFRSNFAKGLFGLSNPKILVRRDGINLEDDDIIATGDTATINSQTYTIIVYGDINSDGKYSYKDILMVNSYVNGGSGATGGTYDPDVKGTGYKGVFYCRRKRI